MVIDDLIVLGRAVPEFLKDGRKTVCMGGYSPKNGFIRIYPTKSNMKIKRWSIMAVEVERNNQDTRKESWKIKGSKNEWESLHLKIENLGEFPKKDRLGLLDSLVSPCVSIINDAKDGLGIIKPTILKKWFGKNNLYYKAFNLMFEGFDDNEGVKAKKDFAIEPRVKFRCSSCVQKTPHNMQILEWGFYRWFEKSPDNPDQVWKNALMDNPDKYYNYFFVGNQASKRTSFMVISVLRGKQEPAIQRPLF